MLLLLSFLLFSFYEVTQCSEEPVNCATDGFSECRKAAGDYFMQLVTGWITWLPSDQNLTENCEIAQTFIGCLAEKAKVCEVDGMSYSNVKALIGEFCVPQSEVRHVYNGNIDCVNENMESILNCFVDAQELAVPESGDYRYRLCVEEYINVDVCTLGIAGRICDEKIYNVGKPMFSRIRGSDESICTEEIWEYMGEAFKNKIDILRKKYTAE